MGDVMKERSSLRRAGSVTGGALGALFGYVVGMEQGGTWGAISGVVICIPIGAFLGPYLVYLLVTVVLVALVPLLLLGLFFYVAGLAVHDVLWRKV
jgi:hypothetical protein